MNYEELSLIVKDVDKKSELIKLPPHFYAQLGTYIQEIKDALSNTEPTAPDHSILEDEFKTVQKFADKILLRRVDKIMELASLSALKDSNSNTSAMTKEEYSMFCDMKDIVLRIKKELFGVDMVDVKPPSRSGGIHRKEHGSSAPVGADTSVDTGNNTKSNARNNPNRNAGADGAGKEDSSHEARRENEGISRKENALDGYSLIRALADIKTFAGPDMREYTLMKDDIATIPDTIAKLLINRHIAVQIFINKEVGDE